MSDETVRLSMVGQLLRRRWRVLTACALLGALVGAGVSALFSPGYQASASVLLQGGTAQDDMVSAPEVATSSAVLDQVAQGLGGQVSVTKLRDSVTAHPGNGTVVVITGDADTPRRAQLLADRVAQEYAAFANQLASKAGGGTAELKGAELRRQVAQTDHRIAELLAAVNRGDTPQGDQLSRQIEGLRSSLDQSVSKLEDAGSTETPTSVTVIGPAQLPDGPASPTLLECILAGGAAGALIGIFVHLVAARMDRRLLGESDIAAALGAPLLGSVDVPVPAGRHRAGQSRPAGAAARAKRMLLGEAPWRLPQVTLTGNDQAQEVRYRRVLARLRSGSTLPLRVLVLAPDDDPAAHHAVGELTAAATSDASQTTLQVVDVRSDRPTVPDSGRVSAVLAVVTAGTRTPWELMGITEACADAGYQLSGVVIAHPAWHNVRTWADSHGPPPAEQTVNGKVRVGST